MPRKSKATAPTETIPLTPELTATEALNREYELFVAERLKQDMEARAYFELDKKNHTEKKKRQRKPKTPPAEQVPTEMPIINATYYLADSSGIPQTPVIPPDEDLSANLQKIINELAKASRTMTKIINMIGALTTPK